MTQGKRAGSRRGPRKRRPGAGRSLLLLASGVTLAVVAWGYLVYAAIDFGGTARGGDARAWWFLALASVGAVACLFVGLMLVARLLRHLGITGGPAAAPGADGVGEAGSAGHSVDPGHSGPPSLPVARPVGGRRAAR